MSKRTENRLFTDKKSVYIAAAVLAVVLSLLFMALFAAAVYFFAIDRGLAPFFSTVSVAAGCFSASFFAGKKTNEKGYLTGLIIGVACFFVITVISLFTGSDGVTLNSLFHFVIVVLASVIGGIFGVNKSGKKII